MALTMEHKYGQTERIWVMDRGMVSEENLACLRQRGARYLVGTPKSMLRKFDHELLAHDWAEVQPGVEVKTCASPDGGADIFVLCRSDGRKAKEAAILDRFLARLEAELHTLKPRPSRADSGIGRRPNVGSDGCWRETAGPPRSSP